MKNNLPSLLDRIKQILAIPSISSIDKRYDIGNREVNLQIANWLDELGFRVKLQQIDENKSNLIATIGPEYSEYAGLVLSGHTDTVPCNEKAWNQNPFRAEVKDGKLYGLGSCDMKSFFSIVIDIVSNIQKHEYKQPLTILATADEETTMQGAKALLRSEFRNSKYAIIGEPTNSNPVRTHKGVMMERITVKGKAGHASNPTLGENAIEKMAKVIQALCVWRDKLQIENKNPHFEIPIPTLNFGSIHGGDCANRICDECTLSIDLRILPKMDINSIRLQLQAVLDDLAKHEELQYQLTSDFEGIPAFQAKIDSDIVKIVEQETSIDAQSVAFGTEAPYLQRLGLETIIYGAGSISQAHQPDEYIKLDQVHKYKDQLSKVVNKLCC